MQKNFPKNLEEVKYFLSWLNPEVLSLDTETDGLRFGCELKGISLCDGQIVGYIDLNNNEYFGFILAEVLNFLGKVKLLILHNAPFDLRVLRQCGINYSGKIFDTAVAAHLLNENASCGLKELVKRKKLEEWENAIDFKEAIVDGYSSQKFINYAINDAIWTYQLYELEKPLLKEQKLEYLFYEIEMPFQFVLLELYENGIKIDVNKLQDFDDLLSAERVIAERDTIESIGLKMITEDSLFESLKVQKPPMNLNSSQQVANVIENQLGIKLPRTEPTDRFPDGQPSTKAEILEPHKEKHPFIKNLLRYRKCEKLLNTFILPLYELIDKDGRLRTSFNDTVAVTGRLSSSSPNLQNIPKHFTEDDIVNVRELFVAEEGKVFIRADWDLQEIRQLANVSGDKNLIHILNSNQDVHLASANGCLGLGLEEEQLIKTSPGFGELKEKYKKDRHIGKNGINFPVIYGSTAYGVAYNNNVSEEVAQGWIDGFFKMYPKVKKAIKRCKNEMYQNHFIRNYFGRKRRFGKIDKHAVRQGFNFWIQGMCADLLRKVMVNLQKSSSRAMGSPKLVLTIHDEIIIEIEEKYAELYALTIKRIMEYTVVDLPVKFIADVKIVKSYGD